MQPQLSAISEANLQSLAELVPELFRTAHANFLSPAQAIRNIHQTSGLIPVALTPEHKVIWLDIGDYQFKEWKFRYAVKNLIAERGLGHCFSSDIKLLNEAAVLTHNLAPTGFIFHIAKCGSTLMAKALAQPHENISLSEPSPLHENLWQYLTRNWQESAGLTKTNLLLIRNLILAMGRRRLPEQRRYFVKFRSWNVVFAEIIQRAFPETPCLFMYRDPREVLVSSLHNFTLPQPRLGAFVSAFVTGYTPAALHDMSDLHYFAHVYERYLHFGLHKMSGRVYYLNYDKLIKKNFSNILQQVFGYLPAEEQLRLMEAQFELYSKDDSSTQRFTSDIQEKRKRITPAIHAAADHYLMLHYRALEQHARNLSKVLPSN